MLWSDPPEEPPEELRAAQAMLRRASWVLVVVSVIALTTIILGLGVP